MRKLLIILMLAGTAVAQLPQYGYQSHAKLVRHAKVGYVDYLWAISQTREGKAQLHALTVEHQPEQEAAIEQSKGYTKLLDAARLQSDFRQQERDVYARVGVKFSRVVDAYARANGFTRIIDVSDPSLNIIWLNSNADLTKRMITLYDKGGSQK